MASRVVLIDGTSAEPLYGTLKTITEVVSSVLTYVGETSRQAALETDPEWRIKRIIVQGQTTTVQYAGNAAFEHKWSSRASLFPTATFFNQLSTLFDGTNQYITFNNNINYNSADQFSVSLWIKPNNLSAIRTLISKVTNDANVYGWSIRHEVTGALTVQVRAPSQLTLFTTTLTVTAGIWNHVVLTYSGSQNISGFSVYINGVLDTVPHTAVISNSWLAGQPFIIGSKNGSQYFSGKVDEVSIWAAQLTASKVAELWNSGAAGNLTNHSSYALLANWWRLGDGDVYPTVVDNRGIINGIMNNMTASSIVGDPA